MAGALEPKKFQKVPESPGWDRPHQPSEPKLSPLALESGCLRSGRREQPEVAWEGEKDSGFGIRRYEFEPWVYLFLAVWGRGKSRLWREVLREAWVSRYTLCPGQGTLNKPQAIPRVPTLGRPPASPAHLVRAPVPVLVHVQESAGVPEGQLRLARLFGPSEQCGDNAAIL